MDKVEITETDGCVAFTVKVVPGSSRTALAGALDGMLKIKIAAAAEKGKANKSLAAYLAKVAGVRKNDVEIVSGLTNPVKQIRIRGLDATAFEGRLGL